MQKFNINESMFIQINEFGWAHLNRTHKQDYIDTCIKSKERSINGEIWYELQCWKVFDLFPPKFGQQILHSSNVLFKESDLKNY